MLALKNVTKSYGKKRVLAGVTFDVRPKDRVCIVGEGGSGKSTLLKLLVRAEDPTSGMVMVDGVDLKAVPAGVLQLYRRRLGVAHQEPMLLLHATVEENIVLPLELFGVPLSVQQRTAADLMKRLNLTTMAGRLAGSLSMSERSLVSIARAIIAAPMIVIADEPLLHLDDTQSAAVTELLRTMHKHGTTLILFSRSEATAKAFGARIVHVADGTVSHAAPKKAPAAKAPSTHRILEEPEEDEPSVIIPDREESPKKPAEKQSKKVRITSIGSGL